MGKTERRLRRKRVEDPSPRSPAPPPSLREPPYGAREGTAESRLAITEAPRDRQDKISGATAALVVAGEEPGARASSGKSLQQQGPPGTGASKGESLQQRGPPRTGASSGKSIQQQGPPRKGAFSGESFQQRKMIEDPGLRSPAPPPSLRGAPHGASKATGESRIEVTEAPRGRQDKIS